MTKQTGIYWLASYPKSGNTWFRIVLSNVLSKRETLTNLDSIKTGAIASGRGWIDGVLGYDSASLTHEELDCILPEVFTYQHENAIDVSHHKIHNAYTYLDKNKIKPLIPPSSCHGVVYIMRNPLDVAISSANHNSCSIDQSINMMRMPNNTFSGNINGQSAQVRHKLCSWSQHVESWHDAPDLNLLTIRYEDMKTHPFETFSEAMAFLKIEATDDEIGLAIDNASMEKLKHLEETKGFKERPPKVESFFRKGKMDDWKENLTSKQIAQIVKDHAVVMDRFDYLDEELLEYI